MHCSLHAAPHQSCSSPRRASPARASMRAVDPSRSEQSRAERAAHYYCAMVQASEVVGSGSPALGLTLVAMGGGSSAAGGRLPGSRPWCLVAPDVLAGAGQHVAAGSAVLVGISTSATPAGAPRVQDLHTGGSQLVRLWHLASIPQQQGAPNSQAADFMVLAHVWPSAKVARGCIAVSAALSSLLGSPQPGVVLALTAWPQQALLQPPSHLGGPLHDCSEVVIRLQAPQPPASSGTSAAPGQQGGAPGTPKQRTPGASTPGTGRGSRPTTPSPAQAATTPGVGAGAPPPSPLPTSSLASHWAPVPGGEGIGGSTGLDGVLVQGGGGAGAGGGTLSERQRELVSAACQSRLAGHLVMQGTVMPVQLLGRTWLCRVEGLMGPCGGGPGAQGRAVAGRVRGASTKIYLLMPGEQRVDLTASAHQHPGAAPGSVVVQGGLEALVARARRLVEEQGLGGGAGGGGGGGGGEVSVEAAMDAAERALRAGWTSSPLTYAALGGVQHLAAQLRQLVTLPLVSTQLFADLRVRAPRGVLLHGPPGSGKTVLARAAAGDAGATLLVINGPEIMSEWQGESEARLRGVFAAARALAPSVVFVDEVDALAPARSEPGGAGGAGGGTSETSARVVTTLLTCMDGPSGMGPGDGVVVVGATNRPSALDSALRRPGRFERELEVGAPPPEARYQMLTSRLRSVRHTLTEHEVRHLAEAAHGFVAADLAALVSEACLSALRRAITSGQGGEGGPGEEGCWCTWGDFEGALSRTKPSALRETAVEIPRVKWEDVGGLAHVKQRLQEAVVWPFKSPERLARLGATAPRGVLLYGPPGCSKTMLAKAVAAEARLNFISIKGGELFSSYVGESEKAVAALFARARATAPTIVFFDEIDALASARSNDSTGGVTDRVMAQLLSELDGLQQRVGVVVLAATNRPDCVDAALLRPGRFDRLIYVAPPDEHSRLDILRVLVRKTPLADDVDLQQLAEGCAGYSGADLAAMVREAALAALEEDITATQVCMRHLRAAQSLVVPSANTSALMQSVYQRFAGGQGAGGQGTGTGAAGPTAPVFGIKA